ncbi:hypothetical protein D3C80_1227510 [compost metagenome]
MDLVEDLNDPVPRPRIEEALIIQEGAAEGPPQQAVTVEAVVVGDVAILVGIEGHPSVAGPVRVLVFKGCDKGADNAGVDRACQIHQGVFEIAARLATVTVVRYAANEAFPEHAIDYARHDRNRDALAVGMEVAGRARLLGAFIDNSAAQAALIKTVRANLHRAICRRGAALVNR